VGRQKKQAPTEQNQRPETRPKVRKYSRNQQQLKKRRKTSSWKYTKKFRDPRDGGFVPRTLTVED
jgi:hypothetical protein